MTSQKIAAGPLTSDQVKCKIKQEKAGTTVRFESYELTTCNLLATWHDVVPFLKLHTHVDATAIEN